MSNRERAMQLLNTIADEKMIYVVGILENLTNFADASDIDIPNAETIATFREGDKMLENGTGKRYSSASSLFADLEA